MKTENILVLGANGKTGKRVVEKLKARGIMAKKGSRNEPTPFDWYKPETWDAVIADTETIYITFQPDLAVPAAVSIIDSFTRLAKKCGVKKLVLLSGRGEKEAQECEELIKRSGLDYVIIRSSWFMQNFSENFLTDSILSGEVVLPTIVSKEPFVDLDDLADVVVEALTGDKYSRQTLELTGSQLLSFREVTEIISVVTGKTISYQEISMEEYKNMLREFQLPEDYIMLIEYLFAEVLDGRNESVTDDLENALGRKPTTFNEFAIKAAGTGIWN